MKITKVAGLTQSFMELTNELSQQPSLFSDRGVASPAVKQVVKRYTGQRAASNEEKCLLAAALRMMQASDREIADALECDVRSIPFMLAAAEKTGRIPALKERLRVLVGANAESASIALQRCLDNVMRFGCSDELSNMIKALSTTVGITTEKYLLLTGSATEIVEHRVAAGRDEVEAWARSNAITIEAEPVADTVANDSKSPAQVADCEQIQAVLSGGNGRDTTSTNPPATPDPTDHAAADQANGGGGGAAAGGGRRGPNG